MEAIGGDSEHGTMVFRRVDAPHFPKLRTHTYSVSHDELQNIYRGIEKSPAFGTLAPGFLGKKAIEPGHMHYGGAITLPLITELRTARDTDREPLSMHYSFENGDTAELNIFLLVKNPWETILGNTGKYQVHAYVRSEDKRILPRARFELEAILQEKGRTL